MRETGWTRALALAATVYIMARFFSQRIPYLTAALYPILKYATSKYESHIKGFFVNVVAWVKTTFWRRNEKERTRSIGLQQAR